MSDHDDSGTGDAGPSAGDDLRAGPEEYAPPDAVDDLPTVTCSRCDREWELDYELDELQVGNRAVEQFALDHERHTGHYPDGVTPWVVSCRRCPDGERFLSERPARRWARTHARHTGHTVELGNDTDDVTDEVVPATVTGEDHSGDDVPTDGDGGSTDDATGDSTDDATGDSTDDA